jgi:uncharacterized protein
MSVPERRWSNMAPVRTCLGCRQRADKSSLLRLVVRDGEVVADHSAILHGRGAWVHPTRSCVEQSITRKAFGRAFRVTGAITTSRDFVTEFLEEQAERQMDN